MVRKLIIATGNWASWTRGLNGTIFRHAYVHYICSSKDGYESSRTSTSSWPATQKGKYYVKPGSNRVITALYFLCKLLVHYSIFIFFQSKRDLITGLKTRTNAGRPNWDKVFKSISAQKKGKVTVFFCGSPQLGKILHMKCAEFGFDFRKENF